MEGAPRLENYYFTIACQKQKSGDFKAAKTYYTEAAAKYGEALKVAHSEDIKNELRASLEECLNEAEKCKANHELLLQAN